MCVASTEHHLQEAYQNAAAIHWQLRIQTYSAFIELAVLQVLVHAGIAHQSDNQQGAAFNDKLMHAVHDWCIAFFCLFFLC